MNQENKVAQSPNENICPLEESNQTGAGTKGSISSRFDCKTIIRQLVVKLKRSKRCLDLQQLAGSDQQYIGQISRPIPHLKQAITSVPSNDLPSHSFRSESGGELVDAWLYCMGQDGEKLFE